MKNRVKSELIILDGENPIQKVPLFVSGEDGHLAVSEIGVGGGDVTNIGANNRNQMSFVMTQMRELQRQNDELKADLQTFKAGTTLLLQNINISLHKLVSLRLARRSETNEESERDIITGQLRKILPINCPQTLGILWLEYEFGIGRNKAAKQFTAKERGLAKFTYSLQKPFWLLVERMIRHRYTNATAIAKIENVCMRGRRKRLTALLRQIQTNERRGGNPELQYS